MSLGGEAFVELPLGGLGFAGDDDLEDGGKVNRLLRLPFRQKFNSCVSVGLGHLNDCAQGGGYGISQLCSELIDFIGYRAGDE
jgi:hypothetical protein